VLSFVNIFTGVADSIYLSAVIPSKSTSLTPSRRPNYCWSSRVGYSILAMRAASAEARMMFGF